MGKVIAKRFIFMIPVVLAVTFIIFMLSFISAGDADRVLAEKKYEHPSPEQVEEVRHEEGLDQPVLVQYGKWLDQALHGDFGKSYSTRKPAFEELKRYFPQTFKLAVTSFLLLMIVSVPLGILSAIYENRVLDKVIRILSSLSVSMPSFFLKVNIHLWSNRKANDPIVPKFPPNLLNTERTSATVRVVLSVNVSTNTAIP